MKSMPFHFMSYYVFSKGIETQVILAQPRKGFHDWTIKTENTTRLVFVVACFLFLFYEVLISLALPSGCRNIIGPHPTECLLTLYKNAGCIREGLANPITLSYARLKELKSSNLKYVVSVVLLRSTISFKK